MTKIEVQPRLVDGKFLLWSYENCLNITGYQCKRTYNNLVIPSFYGCVKLVSSYSTIMPKRQVKTEKFESTFVEIFLLGF